ncbi:MAG: CBASS cGAMP-activated phospholipase [Deferrisomatales bacterium]|nr:CBASS cGAMP-activated phospholipase [Deferrisomatales bacterium]
MAQEKTSSEYTESNAGADVHAFQILSLDGGGIKGLFSAALLAKLEEDLGTNLVDHFDLVVGTSTGGIIALGLGLGLSPKEIVEFYLREGAKIFRPGLLRGLRRVVRSKYSSAPLRHALRECLGDRLLGESRKRLVIPAYNLGSDDLYNFKTAHHPRFKRDFRVPAWQVALATSAAPTYLPACREVDSHRLIDGGMWANNPTMVGLVEALSYLAVPKERISILSLGTSYAVTQRKGRLDEGGCLSWGSHAIDVAFRGQSKGAISQAGLLLGKDRVVRIDPAVPDGLFDLDKPAAAADLLSHAAHESRSYSPLVEAGFLSHRAPEFVPFHRT